MGEKDKTAKTLEGFDDVFADIINVFLFGGKEVLKESELSDVLPKSYYKASGEIREQERDVLKSWNKLNIRISLLGVENQTESENDMPIRVIGYDGAAYRDQIRKGKNDRYPVVTVVLYFGRKPWDKAKTLKEAIEIPKELDPYVNDYKMNLFEVSFLTDEQVKLFKSDFKYVADYFVQVRKNNNYIPPKAKMRHIREVMELLRVMTGDDRLEESLYNTESNKTKGETMGEAWIDAIENRGMKKGIEKGMEKGIEKGKVLVIENALKAGSKPEDISKINGIPLKEVLKVKSEMLEEA